MRKTEKLYYWPIICSLIWLSWVIYFCTIAPSSYVTKIVFFLILFIAILSTVYMFLKRFKTNFIISIYILSLALLLFFHQFNLINSILLTGLFVTLTILVNKQQKIQTKA